MYSEYPIWSVEDARAGVYKRGSIVIYSPDNVLRYIYIATEDYDGSLLPPSVAIGWAYLDTIVDDWQAGKPYKIGNVVRFNRILYVATRRYRGGTAPPNEELDPDGIRTWMLSYEDGETPVIVSFYRKTFGYKTKDLVYPFGNYLEDISYDTMPFPFDENALFGEYDRFASYRPAAFSDSNQFVRQKEQSLINSVMEAHPYHDIYVLGYQPYNYPPPAVQKPFVFYANAFHQSEIRDKLFTFIYSPMLGYSANNKYFIPKRNIPYYGGNSYAFMDLNGLTYNALINGTSLEFYPDEPFENLEIIQRNNSRNFFKGSDKNIFSSEPLEHIVGITPLVCRASMATKQTPKMIIYVSPKNLCVDNIDITFHFLRTEIVCTESSSTGDDGMGGTTTTTTTDCNPPNYYIFNQTYAYNDATRDASPDDDTNRWKGPRYKWVDNPNFDPNCEDDPNDPFDICPFPFAAVVDSAYPDTSIDMSSYVNTSDPLRTVTVQLIGWTIN